MTHGGPWHERGFDPAALKPPKPHGVIETTSATTDGNLKWKVVLAYIASVVIAFGVMILLMKAGW